MQLMTCRLISRSALTGLRKDPLPDIKPLPLLIREGTVRVAESAGEEFADAGVKDLQGQHGFPVSHRKADSVCVDGDDSRVQLSEKG